MIRRYFIAGLVVWVPLVVTLWVIQILFNTMDKTLSLLPAELQPDRWLGFHVPGLGVIFTLLILFFTGMLVTNFIGHRLVMLWEKLLGRIPLVRSIYASVKQVMGTVFSPSGASFRKVLLIQFPRAGVWTIAFQTNNGFALAETCVNQELLTVFVPTTPNPTGGYMLMVPKQEVIELPITVDAALRMVISMGVVTPEQLLAK